MYNCSRKSKLNRSFVIALAAIITFAGMFAYAPTADAAPKIQSNVSTKAIEWNLSKGSLPSDAGTLKAGTKYYFNLSATTDNKFKTSELYIKEEGASKFTRAYSYSNSGYHRYVNYRYAPQKAGTLQYYWKIKDYDNGKWTTYKTNSYKVSKSNSTSNSTNSTKNTDLLWPATNYKITTLNYYWNNGNPKAHSTRWGWSHAIDISGGGNILAAADGKVETVGWQANGFGNYIVIKHDDGNRSLYGHLSSVNVTEGKKVSRGDKIGVMGSTGNSSGVHLHFEIENGNPMDTFKSTVASKLIIGTNVYKANNAMKNEYNLCKTTANWIKDNYTAKGDWYYYNK